MLPPVTWISETSLAVAGSPDCSSILMRPSLVLAGEPGPGCVEASEAITVLRSGGGAELVGVARRLEGGSGAEGRLRMGGNTLNFGGEAGAVALSIIDNCCLLLHLQLKYQECILVVMVVMVAYMVMDAISILM